MINFVRQYWLVIADVLISLGLIGSAMLGTITWTDAMVGIGLTWKGSGFKQLTSPTPAPALKL